MSTSFARFSTFDSGDQSKDRTVVAHSCTVSWRNYIVCSLFLIVFESCLFYCMRFLLDCFERICFLHKRCADCGRNNHLAVSCFLRYFQESVNRISYQRFHFTTKRTTLMPYDNNFSLYFSFRFGARPNMLISMNDSTAFQFDLKAVLFCGIVVFLSFVSIHFSRLYLSFRSQMLPFCEYAAAFDGSPGIIDQILIPIHKI